MKLLLAIVIIAVVALFGSRLSYHNRRLPLGFRTILLAGTEYIFLGVVLGRHGLEILDLETLKMLEPAMLFTLGWIGFLVGLQFDFRQLRKLPRYYFSIAAIQAGATFVVVTAMALVLLKSFANAPLPLTLTTALALGAAACCTSPSALAVVARSYRLQNVNLAGLLRYISGVDGLFGLLFLAIGFSISPLVEMRETGWHESLEWIVTSVALGLVPALILITLSRTKFSHPEFLLFLIGTVMFCAGLTATVDHSPLLSGTVCGIATANLCRHRTRALAVVAHAERSLYVILLLLVGASWRIRFDFGLALIAAYFLARLLGKLAGTYSATRLFRPQYPTPPHLGLGLIPEGGLPIAMILSFGLVTKWQVTDSLITVIVASVLLSDLVGSRLIVSLLGIEDRRHAE